MFCEEKVLKQFSDSDHRSSVLADDAIHLFLTVYSVLQLSSSSLKGTWSILIFTIAFNWVYSFIFNLVYLLNGTAYNISVVYCQTQVVRRIWSTESHMSLFMNAQDKDLTSYRSSADTNYSS